LGVFICCVSFGCESVEGPELDYPCVSWCNTIAPWPHDGNPYETESFVIYSDGVSLEALRTLGEYAEDALVLVKSELGVDNDSLFTFPPGQDKLHIYTYKHRFPRDWGGQGFYGGLIIYSPDHEERTQLGRTDPSVYGPLMKHEVPHMVQGLLLGSIHPSLVDEWVSEGIADYIAGGTNAPPIVDRATLDHLTSTYGELNPIAQHIGDDYTVEEGYAYYYPMYELAVRYLVDPATLNNPLTTFRDLFLELKGTQPCYVGGVCSEFEIAFNVRMGINLADYEPRFFEIIRAYLN
jgi:hypothetical protein